MSHVVLASHLPGEGHYQSARHTIRPVECRGDCDYWQALNSLWDTRLTIVNLEHDLEVTDRHITELVECPHPLCSWVYECHFATTGQGESITAAGTGDWAHHLVGGEAWADWSAIGLVKITPTARTGRLLCRTWQQLERSVHNAVARPWHLHGNAPGKTGHLVHHHW